MEKITKFLIKTVKKASKLITPKFEVKAKDEHGDLVTNFDYEIEKFITIRLKNKFPSFSIVSEEYNSVETIYDNCFVIDPIDGTVNFAHGLPLWGIQVACVKNGKTCSSVIYLPKLNELYYADSTGAYCNKKPISVKSRPLVQTLFAIDGGNTTPSIVRIETKDVRTRSTKCSCVNYSWTAKGCFGGVIYKRNHPWDYVPGAYLVQQAGGIISDNPNEHIAACNQDCLDILKQECGYYKNDIATTQHD